MATAFSGREAVTGRRESNYVLQMLRHVDFALLASALALALMGIVMVYTATRSQLAQAGISPHYYMERQVIWVFLGVVLMVLVALFDYHVYQQWGYYIYGLIVCSLVGVFVIGTHVYGSQRWYHFGPLQLQPSEFAPIGVIIAVATYCSRRKGVLEFREMVAILILAGVPMGLVFLQPDLGTAILLGVSLSVMLVAAGVRLRYLALLLVAVVTVVVLALQAHLLKQYQMQRLTGFLHPNSGLSSYNYDTSQAKIAIASGGVSGTGFGAGSSTNGLFIPNQQNDFIFSAVGEQLGFLGSAVVIGLFGIISFRILRAAQSARDSFGRMLCAGALAFIGFSVFENIGMTIGLTPVTGIPLPFISYGGSAAFAFFATVGLVLNVEMRRFRRG